MSASERTLPSALAASPVLGLLSELAETMSRIDLACEQDFTLGPLLVRPARREVQSHGVTRQVERRIMQVLVALAHPTWEVVSQRELNLRCWSGLAVSNDAIGRCIGALRRLAAEWPEPPFAIATIGGVGYELQPRAC